MSMFGGRILRLLANRNRSNLYRFRLQSTIMMSATEIDIIHYLFNAGAVPSTGRIMTDLLVDCC